MTPALIIGSALNLGRETTAHLVSLSLLISGIAAGGIFAILTRMVYIGKSRLEGDC